MGVVFQGGVTGAASDVGGTTHRALNTQVKPIDHSNGAHFRANVRIGIIASTAANARLFEIRNTFVNSKVIITRLYLQFLQNVGGTVAMLHPEALRTTQHTSAATTNTQTPTPSRKRGDMTARQGAEIRALTSAGNTAGMTGGALITLGDQHLYVPFRIQATIPTTSQNTGYQYDAEDDILGTHPYVLNYQEGIQINLGATAMPALSAANLYLGISWVEVAGAY